MNRSTWTVRRSSMLTIISALALLLEVMPAAAKTVFQDDVALIRCGTFQGSAARRFRIDQDGNADLRIQVSDGIPGAYTVLVAGVDQGILVVNSFGQGQIEYDSSPSAGQQLIDFPLAVDTEIDLEFSNMAVAFSLSNDNDCQTSPGPGTTGTTTTVTVTTTTDTSASSTSTTGATGSSTTTNVAGSSTTTNVSGSSTTTNATGSSTTTNVSGSSTTTLPGPVCQAVEQLVSLRNCGVSKRATGDRRVRVRVNCTEDLRVRINKVPSGSYGVYVGGVFRGTLTASGGQGELEFDDTPAVNELPLTFDPFGALAVKKDGRTILAYPTCP